MFSFKNVIGNEKLIENLKLIHKQKRLAHAYIFDGGSGTGKKLVAFSFAKLISCKSPKDSNPCNQCNSCLTFESRNNPDLIFIKSDKKSIGIDTIRDRIGQNINIKPLKQKHKIFIIDSADTMTIQAQNAILKTIEEPPAYALFLLISNNFNRFLPTILSRCNIFKIKPLKEDEIEKYISGKFEIDKNTANIYSAYAQGSLGKAIKMLSSEEFKNMYQEVTAAIKDLNSSSREEKDYLKIYYIISELEKYKSEIQQILDIFYLTYRDALIFKYTNTEHIIQKNTIDTIASISGENSHKEILDKLTNILNAKVQFNQNANFNMAMECLLINL